MSNVTSVRLAVEVRKIVGRWNYVKPSHHKAAKARGMKRAESQNHILLPSCSQSVPMLSLSQGASSFWKVFCTQDSFLPFVLSFVFWATCWIYYRWILRSDYSKWYKIHTLHHVVAITLGSLSLYFHDDAVFNERIGIFWSMPYFIVDIVDCLYMGHSTYILHGAICLGLGLCNYHVPLLFRLRMNSKAVFIESSSILLYQVKQNRNPVLFSFFALNYTLCRIVWIPIMGKQLLAEGLKWYHPIILVLGAFYGLQVHWWIKILKILKEGASSSTTTSAKTDEKRSQSKKKE